jgi:hypothetical protein
MTASAPTFVPPETVAASAERNLHPLVAYVKQRLEALAGLVELEFDGLPVRFDGFRLRNLENWAVSADRSLLDNFGSLSGYCNARCNFCYEFGNPLPYDLTMLGVAEARTRARYFDASQGRGLIQFAERLDLESFTNPKLVELLTIFRGQDPNHVITLTTNGARLDPPTLAALTELRPIQLVISLNSANPAERQAIMHDPRAAASVEAVRRMRSYGIPYTGGIVAWPDLAEDDLRRTIHFFDEHGARAIRVSLPSYSQYFSGGQKLFDTKPVWDRLFAVVEEEADRISTPLSAAPYLPRGVAIIPRISGVIPNSPAAAAGVRRGDIVETVGGQPVQSRMHAKRLIARALLASGGVLNLTIRRGDSVLDVLLDDRLDLAADLYPYKPAGYRSPTGYGEVWGSLGGLFLNDDIDLRDLATIPEFARARGAKSVVVMSSSLLADVVSLCFEKSPQLVEATRDLTVIVAVPPHRFWGGNISVGDLYLCED